MTAEPGGSRRGIIITGGGTGIGRAIARAFARNNENVLVVGRTERTLAETADGFPSVQTLVADLSEPESAEAAVQAALRLFGRVDVVVNNASVAVPAPLEKIDQASVSEQLDVNLRAPVFLTQHAIDALTQTRGTVVNISSAGSLGRRAWPQFSLYGATKVALDFLTRTWAAELGSRGIRVVSIAPGVIATGMGVRMGATPEQYEQFLTGMAAQTPLGRVGQPEEIAWWVLQVTDPSAAFATGTVLVVDGGASTT